MKRLLSSLLTLTVALSFIACGSPSKGGETLVSVGSKNITDGDLELLAKINPRLKGQLSSEFGKKKIVDNLVEQELLYQASKKEGLNKDPLVKDKIDLYKKVIISQAYMDEKLKEAAKEEYDKNKKSYEKLQLSHILIKTKKNKKGKVDEKATLKETTEIKEKLDKGDKFEVIAKEYSEDNLTKKRGGDLGFASIDEARLTRRGYGPLLEKAFTMKVGEVSGPIKAKDGYHIITVTKGKELQPFDAVSQNILFKIRANARNKIIGDLKETYKVTYSDKLTDKKKIEKDVFGKKKGKGKGPGKQKGMGGKMKMKAKEAQKAAEKKGAEKATEKK